jgi:hypothetical protein
MVSKCANPVCSATFRYFHQGKLFRFDTPSRLDRRCSMGNGDSPNPPLRRLEFYWLCENCVQKMTLVFEKDAGIIARPKPLVRSAAA